MITSFDDIEDIKLKKFDHFSEDVTDTHHKTTVTSADHPHANDTDSRDLESTLHSSDLNVTCNATDENERSDSSPCIDSSSSSSSEVRLDTDTALYSADIWCIPSALQDPKNFCTSLFFDAAINGRKGKGKETSNNSGMKEAFLSADSPNSYDVLQPCYRLVETSILLCSKCATLFDKSLVVADAVNLNIFTCMSQQAISIGMAYPHAAETLLESSLLHAFNLSSPIILHVERALLHAALDLQVQARNSTSRLSSQTSKILLYRKERENRYRSQLLSGCVTIARYDDPERLKRAKLAIDFSKIRVYSSEFSAQRKSEGKFNCVLIFYLSATLPLFGPSSFSHISFFVTFLVLFFFLVLSICLCVYLFIYLFIYLFTSFFLSLHLFPSFFH